MIETRVEIGNDHAHTWNSDGEMSTPETSLLSLLKGMDRIEITDHDTIRGWSEEVKQYNKILKEVSNIHLKDDGTVYPMSDMSNILRTDYIRYILQNTGNSDFVLNKKDHLILPDQPGILKFMDLKIGQGVELSAQLCSHTFHILGLIMKKIKPQFNTELKEIGKMRRKRAEEMINYLYTRHGDDKYTYFFQKTLEYLKKKKRKFPPSALRRLIRDKPPITIEDILAIAPIAPSRLTVGLALLNRYGPKIYGFATPAQVRDIYLARGMKSCIPVKMYSPKQATQRILKSGGIPVLAHPDQKKPKYWLDKGFSAFPEEKIVAAVRKKEITEEDIKYAREHGLIRWLIKLGIRGVEDSYYANKHNIEDFSSDTDWHGPKIKINIPIISDKRSALSLDKILEIRRVNDAHNSLLEKLEKDKGWLEIYEKSTAMKNELVHKQTRIKDFLPHNIDEILTLGEYMDKYLKPIIYVNPPNFYGTLKDLIERTEWALNDIIKHKTYVSADGNYNERIHQYLHTIIDNLKRKEILKYALVLHEIGKPLTFGVEELKEPIDGKSVRVVFPLHDTVGYELLGLLKEDIIKKNLFSEKEFNYIRKITRYHDKVHDAMYRIVNKLRKGYNEEKIKEKIEKIFNKPKIKTEVVIDSLLLVKAMGKAIYYGANEDYKKYYIPAIEMSIKVGLDHIEKL